MNESQVAPNCLVGQEVLLSVGSYRDEWGIVRSVSGDMFIIEVDGDRQAYSRDQFRTHAQCELPNYEDL